MPEVEYRPIEGKAGYRVGSDGSVWSCLKPAGPGRVVISGRWKRLASQVNKRNGYHYVSIGRNLKLPVQHVVLNSFVGPRPPGLWGLHKDGDSSNNSAGNLYWGTPKANSADAIRHGTHQRGEKSGHAKLTEADVVEIRRSTESDSEAARRFGISRPHVSGIRSRRFWKHLV
jgi:hypothetical protein